MKPESDVKAELLMLSSQKRAREARLSSERESLSAQDRVFLETEVNLLNGAVQYAQIVLRDTLGDRSSFIGRILVDAKRKEDATKQVGDMNRLSAVNRVQNFDVLVPYFSRKDYLTNG